MSALELQISERVCRSVTLTSELAFNIIHFETDFFYKKLLVFQKNNDTKYLIYIQSTLFRVFSFQEIFLLVEVLWRESTLIDSSYSKSICLIE